MAHSYGVSDVERLLHLSRGTIRGLVSRGFVVPARGPRRELRFSFQDLVILRTARALVKANVSSRRIGRSLSALRRQLPKSVPLTGITICAVGNEVVVRKGGSRWQPESGQYLLELDVSVAGDSLEIVEIKRRAAPGDRTGHADHGDLADSTAGAHPTASADPADPADLADLADRADSADLADPTAVPHATASAGRSASASPGAKVRKGDMLVEAQTWFEHGLAVEERDVAKAIAAYERCHSLDARHVGARINLGRLHHEAGRFDAAERVYREALRKCEPDPTLYFNLGVLLEDTSRHEEAVEAYLEALTADPDLADAHFNLARLYEALGQPQHAIRHLGVYRRLLKA